jgi:hypothetical protein
MQQKASAKVFSTTDWVLAIHGIFSSGGAVLGNDGALFTKESTSIMVGRRFGESQVNPQTLPQKGRPFIMRVYLSALVSN